jgi:hypothetical protein
MILLDTNVVDKRLPTHLVSRAATGIAISTIESIDVIDHASSSVQGEAGSAIEHQRKAAAPVRNASNVEPIVA